jgi:hypothetical protein
MNEKYFRYTNRDIVYNETEKKCSLTFNIEGLDDEMADDKTMIMLAIDALADLIIDNGADPMQFMQQIVDHKGQMS